MKTRVLIVATTAAALFGPLAYAGANDVDKKSTAAGCPALEVRCPVSGEKIDRKVFVETKGMKVYFCCTKCIEKYKADPAKYVTQVKSQQIALAPKKVQVNCPACGKGIDRSVSMKHHDQELYFCCDKCMAKFEAKPSEFEKDILARCYTTQVLCPVSGEDIDPEVSTKTRDGTVVYFCCPNCIKRFESAPDKYMKNVALGIGASEHPCADEAEKSEKAKK